METTIAAISTAMSESGIGIIRVSGPEALDIVSRIYRSKGGKKDINKVPTHTIHYGYIYDGEELIDEVLVMVMRAPRTFTGEEKRSKNSFSRRIYKAGIFKWQDGSFSGGSSNGCHSGKK